MREAFRAGPGSDAERFQSAGQTQQTTTPTGSSPLRPTSENAVLKPEDNSF
jgi:hypothetical protein